MFKKILPLWLAALALPFVLARSVQAAPVARLEVRPVQSVLAARDQPQLVTLQVRLEGIPEPAAKRAPINFAMVLDRSGSMSGEKIEKVREAALMVLDRLGPADVLSIVTYDDKINVLQPAAHVKQPEAIRRRIRSLNSGNMTALFAGVSKGLAEARKFKGEGLATRLLLVSDGQANVGPSSPSELAALGRSAAREGIPVSTIGLGEGYNEDLMQQLAQASDGNHDFVADASGLSRVFDRELGDAGSVVATDIRIRIECPQGVRPVRVIDRESRVNGQEVILDLNQLYGAQQKYLLLEVEVPASSAGTQRELAQVAVDYKTRATGAPENLRGSTAIRFSGDAAVVRSSVIKEVKAAEVRAKVNEGNKKAIEMRDKGQAPAAKALMSSNAAVLEEAASTLGDTTLAKEALEQRREALDLEDDSKWMGKRKMMRSKAHKVTTQSKE